VRHHARAQAASIEIRGDASQLYIHIEDDGVGFGGEATPWSITSRVREVGGQVRILASDRPGAHLLITLPQA
jgi:signal transduction histidine kinase